MRAPKKMDDADRWQVVTRHNGSSRKSRGGRLSARENTGNCGEHAAQIAARDNGAAGAAAGRAGDRHGGGRLPDAGYGGGDDGGGRGQGSQRLSPEQRVRVAEHIARRQEARARKAELAAAARAATEARDAAAAAAKKRKTLSDTARNKLRLAEALARENTVPVDDAQRASFRHHADPAIPQPPNPAPLDADVEAALRVQLHSQLKPVPRHDILGHTIPEHRRYSAYYLGYRGPDGSALYFGDSASVRALLNAAGDSAGVNLRPAWEHIVQPTTFPGGYTILFFDTCVENDLRHSIDALARGEASFLFSHSCPPSVPVQDVALLARGLVKAATDCHATASTTRESSRRDLLRAKAIGLDAYSRELTKLPHVPDAVAAGARARELADAAAHEAAELHAAEEAAANATKLYAAATYASAAGAHPPAGPAAGDDAPSSRPTHAADARASPAELAGSPSEQDPTPAEERAHRTAATESTDQGATERAVRAAAATAAADAAATAAANERAARSQADRARCAPSDVDGATADALVHIGAVPPAASDSVPAPEAFQFGPGLTDVGVPTGSADDNTLEFDSVVSAFIDTEAGQEWLRLPTPNAPRQACHWLLDSNQGARWLASSSGLDWLETGASDWYRAVLRAHDKAHGRESGAGNPEAQESAMLLEPASAGSESPANPSA